LKDSNAKDADMNGYPEKKAKNPLYAPSAKAPTGINREKGKNLYLIRDKIYKNLGGIIWAKYFLED
jgi:hypothetical protein